MNPLKSVLKRKCLVLGIGNILRQDDGVGTILASRIREEKHNFSVLDAGLTPENLLGKILKLKPEILLIIDAVDFRGSPGEIKILTEQEIKTKNLFLTHNSSLELFINYLKDNLAIDIIILAVQPKSLNFGQGLSKEVEESMRIIESWFKENK